MTVIFRFIFSSVLVVAFSASAAHCALGTPTGRVLDLRPFTLTLKPSQSSLSLSPVPNAHRVRLGALNLPFQRMSLRGGGGATPEAPRYSKLKGVMREVFDELDKDHDGKLHRDDIKRNAKRFSENFIDCEVITAPENTIDGHVNKFLAAVDALGREQISWEDLVSTFVASSAYRSEEELAADVQQQTSVKRIDDLENRLHQLLRDS